MNDEYDLQRCHVGEIHYVKRMCAFVLSSQSIFVGDVDDKSKYMDVLAFLLSENLCPKIYETHSGLRFILQDTLWNFGEEEDLILSILERSQCDPKYIEMCMKTKTFRARVTQKFMRREPWICRVMYRAHWIDRPQLTREFIQFHDKLTLGA